MTSHDWWQDPNRSRILASPALAAALVLGAAVGAALRASLRRHAEVVARSPSRAREPVAARRLQPSPADLRARVQGRRRDHGVAAPDTSSADRRSAAQGSGFVYTSAGHVVTNQHVVDGARSLSVASGTARRIGAELVGTRSLDGSRGHQGRRTGSRSSTRSRSATRAPPGRRPGRRDRQPVRPRGHGDDRDRQRPPPADDRAEQLHDQRLDPDGRRDQPRQLRRAAPRRARPCHRRQRADRERLRRQRRRRVRDPVEHRALDRQPARSRTARSSTHTSASRWSAVDGRRRP